VTVGHVHNQAEWLTTQWPGLLDVADELHPRHGLPRPEKLISKRLSVAVGCSDATDESNQEKLPSLPLWMHFSDSLL
jgi:hypothetical protein